MAMDENVKEIPGSSVTPMPLGDMVRVRVPSCIHMLMCMHLSSHHSTLDSDNNSTRAFEYEHSEPKKKLNVTKHAYTCVLQPHVLSLDTLNVPPSHLHLSFCLSLPISIISAYRICRDPWCANARFCCTRGALQEKEINGLEEIVVELRERIEVEEFQPEEEKAGPSGVGSSSAGMYR
jgi:hypothetical protein